MNKRLIIFVVVGLLMVGLLVWLFIASSKPIPGEKALQDGRAHLPEGSNIEYKFNPPTSGNHYPSWITKGFYDTPRPDGNLVHSQEHGYIIFWYNCERSVGQRVGVSVNLIKTVYAQDATAASNIQMTSGSEGSASATLSELPRAFSDGSCNNLKNQLKDILNKFGPHKLIAAPREGMEYPLIVTAWGRMLKLNKVDEEQIKQFIDAYRDAGPEQTVEP